MKKINFGIKGAYGERNFGDDALLFFLQKWATNNKLKVHFIGRKAPYIATLFPESSYITKDNFHKYFFKILLLGGGTQFFSFKGSNKKASRIKSIFTNPILFFHKLLTYIEKRYIYKSTNHKHLFALGIGLGPFIKDSDEEIVAKKQIPLMKAIYPRDIFSFTFSSSVNINTFAATDICFSPNIIDYKILQKNCDTVKKIGIIVRDWNYLNGGQGYLDRVLEELKNTSFDKYKISFILFKDEKQCEIQLIDKGYDIVKWNPESQNIYEFLEILSTYDLFISARFHGVIFGSLLNIPSIAIEIEPKLNVTKELLKEGVKIWEQPFNENLGDIVENISIVEMRHHLETNVSIQVKKAENMFDHLTYLLKNEY